VRSLFGYLPLFQHHYLIGIFYGAQAVGYDNYCFVLEELLQITLYYFFIVRIEGIGSFVEEQIIGITVDGACYQDALFLSLAQSLSRIAYFRIVFQRQ
jgi:hypothetical protein